MLKYIKNGKIILKDGEVEGKALVFSGKVIGIIEPSEIGAYGFGEVFDAEGGIVSPGLIDLHIHGYMGCDVSDGDKAGLEKMSVELTHNGVTAFLPTTMTVSKNELEKAFDAVRESVKEENDGARVLGVNAEGPFISSKMKGAQKEENILPPSADFLLENKDIIKLTTIAPETENAYEVIKKVKANSNIVVSMGHTDADFEIAKKGVECGISHATHLFNAMSPLKHRAPGVVGAALTDDGVSCELIADTFHVDPSLYTMLYRVKGDKLVLITDCTRAGGLCDGEYDLGGQVITLKGIECRLKDGTVAGSVLTLNKALYNFRKYTGLPDYKVISLASANPASVLGDYTRGTLEKDKRADIVIFDNDFNVKKVFIAGKEII